MSCPALKIRGYPTYPFCAGFFMYCTYRTLCELLFLLPKTITMTREYLFYIISCASISHLSIMCTDKRFVDHSQRVVNPPSVQINDAATNGTKAKKAAKNKAYRRSDSAASSGGTRSRSATKELALPPDDSLMCPPSFKSGLNPEQSVNDGERLELRVAVKGDPEPRVEWTKDGKPLSSTAAMEVKYKNGVASVTIEEVFPEDSGRYACKATNTKGAVETASRISVAPMSRSSKAPAKAVTPAASSVNGVSSLAPRIFKHTASGVVKDGAPVKLECTIAGDSRFTSNNAVKVLMNKLYDFFYCKLDTMLYGCTTRRRSSRARTLCTTRWATTATCSRSWRSSPRTPARTPARPSTTSASASPAARWSSTRARGSRRRASGGQHSKHSPSTFKTDIFLPVLVHYYIQWF